MFVVLSLLNNLRLFNRHYKSALKFFILFVTFIIFELIHSREVIVIVITNNFYWFFFSLNSLICLLWSGLVIINYYVESMFRVRLIWRFSIIKKKNKISVKSSHHRNGIVSKAFVCDGRKKSVSTIWYGVAGTCNVSFEFLLPKTREKNVLIVNDKTIYVSNLIIEFKSNEVLGIIKRSTGHFW